MEIENVVEDFKEIIDKYSLKEKAEEISSFLTSGKCVSVDEFASEFGMEKKEAEVFLKFIEKGLRFKEKHIDGK